MNTWTMVKLTGWLAVLALAMLMVPATETRAGSVHATAPQLVSGATPLSREGEPGWCGSPSNFQDWEQDNSLSVNPTNPDNLAVAWMQDFADAIAVGYSTDGGGTWDTVLPPTNSCTHAFDDVQPMGLYNSALDPWLSFGPDGILYLSSTASSTTTFNTATVVNRSVDDPLTEGVDEGGGRTWESPVVLDAAEFPLGVDGSYVIADPKVPGRAYGPRAMRLP